MSQTQQTMENIRREAEQLLRELELALVNALLAFKRPGPAAQGMNSKFQALYRKMDQEVALSGPHTRDYYRKLRQGIETQRRSQLSEAEAAFRRLPQQQGIAGGYNDFVGSGLSQLPGEGTRGLSKGVDTMISQLVNSTINHPDVPGNVKNQIARGLSAWIQQQQVSQDAFYLVQNVLISVSSWLHQKLTIKRQIEQTRDQVKGRDQVTSQEAGQADETVGALAKRSQELDRQLEQQIAAATRNVRGYFTFNPKLVLDPAKGFLDSVEARAGIRMQPNGVRVDLGVGIKVVDPFSPDAVSINPGLKINPGNGMKIGLEGNSTYQVDGQRWSHSVKATLSWSF